MNAHRAAGDPRPHPTPTDDELAERITRALHARAAAQATDVDALTARLHAEAARRAGQPAPVVALRRGGRVVAAGLVTGTLAVAGAGAAAAADPYSPVARAVETAAQAVGIQWSAMPEGYTREQHDAVWAAYEVEDVERLSALWQTDPIETKARAGQMLLDGEVPPVAPRTGATAPTPDPSAEEAALEAYWASGYTTQDAEALSDLWHVELTEAKARAGQLLVEGQPVPVAPSGASEGAGATDRATPSH
ncbi:hypothetical protein [Cellulomonas sp. B6]|jgi:hypothetical protein|uniref:hypothetical protein n=1 Tax=Cellulomonas sp. B6 TaxID=1295626 RepID=UPI00073C66F8|nr:hypothetical protein [Cellulomonas sp. B6]KSW21454.1 hypothetical protein ATM99_14340 [Cellulomonas sp. B6]